MPVIKADDAEVQEDDTGVSGHYRMLRLSDAGDLTQFGAHHETLFPGARSSICHWHTAEDEFVYMLAGEVALHEGGESITLHPGDAATFKAGVARGHYLENRGDAPASYLIVGTRAQVDRVTYPDHDRVLEIDRQSGNERWTDHAGAPASNPYRDT